MTASISSAIRRHLYGLRTFSHSSDLSRREKNDEEFGVLGATHFDWRPDVRAVVLEALSEFPGVTANTYIGHPEFMRDSEGVGFDMRSADFWGPEGRGTPIHPATGTRLTKFLFDLRHGPLIRHYIYRHTLWTRWGGTSYWTPNDHAGKERHLHVTWW